MKKTYEKNKDKLLEELKKAGKTKHIIIQENNNKIKIKVDPFSQLPEEQRFPVIFKGKIIEADNKTTIKGRFTYGFNFYTLVIVAILLIVARLVASIIQKQIDNIVLCVIALALLIVVIVMIIARTSSIKELIKELLDKSK